MVSYLRTALSSVALAATMVAAPISAVRAQDDLPAVSFTSAQVDRGHTEYARSCVDCHGANLDDGEFGGAPLKGNSFKAKWFGMTADALYGFMSSAMPPDRPGRLSPQVYADLEAYILAQNGIQAGTTELPGDLDKLAGLMVK